MNAIDPGMAANALTFGIIMGLIVFVVLITLCLPDDDEPPP